MKDLSRQPVNRCSKPVGSCDRYTIDFSGHSMSPVLRPGDRLIVRCLPAENIEVGDILVFRNNAHPPAAHRLVKRLSQNSGLTKGDAMPAGSREQVTLTGTADRVDAVIRGKRIILLSAGFQGATKRWQAFLSRRGWTSGAIRHRLQKSLNGRPAPSRLQTASRKDFSRWLAGSQARLLHPGDWNRALALLLSEGMAGVAYRRFRGRQMPSDVWECLANAYHAAVQQNLIHLNFIERLENALEGTSAEVMVVKGGALLHHVYRHVGMRPMEDIDLLVRPAHHRQLAARLTAMGFRQNPLRTYSFTNNRMRLDIHFHALNTDRIASRRRLFPRGMEPIWQKAVSWDKEYRHVMRPSDADHILLLCQHLMKHYYCRLIWFEDLRCLLEGRDEQFLQQLYDRAVELAQVKPLVYSLYLLRRLLGFAPPRTSVFGGICSQLGFGERLLLQLALIDQQVDLLAPLLTACCIGDLRKRLDYLKESLFLSSEVLAMESDPDRRTSRFVRGFLRIHRAGSLLWNHLWLFVAVIFKRQVRMHSTDSRSCVEQL